MSASKLQVLIDSTVAQFNEAKKDGVLTLSEVVKIAGSILKDIYALEGVSTEEKKAFVLMALKRGLDAAGSLQGLSHVDPALVAEVEKQSIHMAVTAVFGLGDAFPQAFAEIHTIVSYIRSFLSKYLPGCSQAAAVAAVLDPKDAALIAEAVKGPAAAAAAPAPAETLEVRSVETTPPSTAPAPQL
jgi:hypothetical protein